MSETEQALTELAGLIESGGFGGKGRHGGSRFYVIAASTGVAKWTIDERIMLTGIKGISNSFAVTKNGMTWTQLNALSAGSLISGGAVLYYRENNSVEGQGQFGDFKLPLNVGDIVTISNGGAAQNIIMLFFDYIDGKFNPL